MSLPGAFLVELGMPTPETLHCSISSSASTLQTSLGNPWSKRTGWTFGVWAADQRSYKAKHDRFSKMLGPSCSLSCQRGDDLQWGFKWRSPKDPLGHGHLHEPQPFYDLEPHVSKLQLPPLSLQTWTQPFTITQLAVLEESPA